MRVLYLHQHFTTPEKGGGTRSYELAKRLIARGHSVCIVCGEFAKLDLTPTEITKQYRREYRWYQCDPDLFALF